MDKSVGNNKLRLSLRIISGRLHPANLSDDQLSTLGFEDEDIERGIGTDNDILEMAEENVFNAIRFQ